MKCRFAAGICTLDADNPCSACESYSASTWGKLRKSFRDARQKADSDITDVDLDSSNVAAHSQIIEVSVHQGPVEATSAIVHCRCRPDPDHG